MKIIVFIFSLFVTIAMFIRAWRSFVFRSTVKKLFKGVNTKESVFCTYTVSDSIPEVVDKYFKMVLPTTFLPIKTLRLRHSGTFRISAEKDWMKINGEEYFITSSPGFIWKGKTKLFTAVDQFYLNKGSSSIDSKIREEIPVCLENHIVNELDLSVIDFG